MIKALFPILLNGIIAVTSASNGQPGINKEIVVLTDEAHASKATASFQFRAYSKDSYLNGISSEMSGSHPFGDLVAKKLYLMEDQYTSEENPYPGNPASRTVIKKPVIFEAVKSIERYLKKSVKKGDTTVDAASTTFNYVLDVALNILTEDTREFEKAVKASSDPKSKIDLFTKRVVLKY
jgi:hypothetical protein